MNKNNKKFIVESELLKEAIKRNLSLKEFIIIMYFDNDSECTFDVKKIAKTTNLTEEDVLYNFGLLLDKKILLLNNIKDEKTSKYIDRVSLELFYDGIDEDNNKIKKENEKNKFYDDFQKIFDHPLSSSDFTLINALCENYNELLILKAAEEAKYNGVLSIRYIDKILYEWKKNNINTVEDLNNSINNKKKNDYQEYDNDILGYNWLDEE